MKQDITGDQVTARTSKYDSEQVAELLLQALETERGGIEIYTTAIQAAQNEDLKKEWREYLEETRTHEQVLVRVFQELGMDVNQSSPGRKVAIRLVPRSWRPSVSF